MRKKILISLLIAWVLLASGCEKAATSPTSDSGEENYLQKAESLRGNFFYTGECGEECQKVIDAYNEAVRLAKDPEVRAEARQRLSEFLFWLKKFDEGLKVARDLVDSAPTNNYRCTGMILIAQNLKGIGNYEAALDYFNNARNYCGSDKQQFLKDNMCTLYDQSGQRDKAEALCPGKYS